MAAPARHRTAAPQGCRGAAAWTLVAAAYRQQRRLPVRLGGKYLLEDDEQGYPPLFGIVLGLWRLDRVGTAAVVALAALVATGNRTHRADSGHELAAWFRHVDGLFATDDGFDNHARIAGRSLMVDEEVVQ